MSFNYNHVVLVGRLVKSPVFFESESVKKAGFRIAVSRNYRKENGTIDADFINIVIWGRLAEIAVQYLKKGDPVLIDGRLHVRQYKEKEEVKWMTEVVGDGFQLLTKKDATRQEGMAQAQKQAEDPQPKKQTGKPKYVLSSK